MNKYGLKFTTLALLIVMSFSLSNANAQGPNDPQSSTRTRPDPTPDSVDDLKEAVGGALVGVRGGIGFDPELIYVGAHAQIGPFVKNVWFRPSYEFGFGQVTQLQSLNLEFAYYLPYVARTPGGNLRNAWNTYIGAGPALHLARHDFELEENDREFNFTDWDFDSGLNFLMGVSRGPTFVELRAGAYGSPAVKIVVGHNFRR